MEEGGGRWRRRRPDVLIEDKMRIMSRLAGCGCPLRHTLFWFLPSEMTEIKFSSLKEIKCHTDVLQGQFLRD